MPAFRDDSVTHGWFTAERWTLGSLLLFTLLVRGGVLWAMRGNLQQDPDAYREIAEFLVQRGEFALGKLSPLESASRPVATAYRPPLYPVILSNLPSADGEHISLIKVSGLHLLLGVATVWLTWLAARRMVFAGDQNAAAGIGLPTVAGLIVACDPLLLNQQTLVMTETLAAFLAIMSLWCLGRFDRTRSWFDAGLAGGGIGLAVLCRPTFLPWLGLVAIAMLFVRGRNSEVKNPNSKKGREHALAIRWAAWWSHLSFRVANAVALVVAAAAVISPWAIRNYREFGKPIVATTHGGYTLLLGNNEDFYRWLGQTNDGLPWDARGLQARLWQRWSTKLQSFNRSELAFDEMCYEQARHAIYKMPGTFIYACAYRVGQLWSPLPHKLKPDESMSRRLLRYATCAWYCGVYVLAAIGVWRLRWKLFSPPWVWGVLLCFVFTAVHTFYFTNIRMRAPLMPFVAIVAAAGIPRRLCFRISSGEESHTKA